MKNFKKNLNAVSKEIKALQKKVDKLLVVVGKVEKPKVVKKTVKKAPAKKTVPVKKKATAAKTKTTKAKKPAVKKRTAKKLK